MYDEVFLRVSIFSSCFVAVICCYGSTLPPTNENYTGYFSEEYTPDNSPTDDPLTFDPFTDYEYNFTTPRNKYTVTTTLSPAQFEEEINRRGVTGEMRQSMIEQHKKDTESNLRNYVKTVERDFRNILSYLRKTYMSREYVTSHPSVRLARDELVDAKLDELMQPKNFVTFPKLQSLYNESRRCEERERSFKKAFNSSISSLYHSSTQFQLELFLTWLLNTSVIWTREQEAAEDLFSLYLELQSAVDAGMRIQDFVQCVLTHLRKFARVSTDNVAKVYDEIARSEIVYAKLWRMELTWDEPRRNEVIDTVYGERPVKFCLALLRKVYIYMQPSSEKYSETEDRDSPDEIVDENYEFVEFPDEIYQMEKRQS